MIDLSSKDFSYINLKAIDIERMLKKIKPDMKELTSSQIVNMALITFAYLIEGNYFDEVPEGDLRLTLYDDVIYINLENETMELKFKNALVNHILEQKPISEFNVGETLINFLSSSDKCFAKF